MPCPTCCEPYEYCTCECGCSDCQNDSETKLRQRIAALKSQLAAAQERVKELEHEVRELRMSRALRHDQYEAEKARADQDRTDAERYRWLFAEHNRIDPMAGVSWKRNSDRSESEWANMIDGNDLTKHIDAARATQKESEDVK